MTDAVAVVGPGGSGARSRSPSRRGFFDYSGGRRETFETAKVRALLRQLKRERP